MVLYFFFFGFLFPLSLILFLFYFIIVFFFFELLFFLSRSLALQHRISSPAPVTPPNGLLMTSDLHER